MRPTIEVEEKITITRTYWATFPDGFKYDATEILALLVEIEGGESLAVSPPLGDWLVKQGVLNSKGSYGGGYGATMGPQFYPFQKMLEGIILPMIAEAKNGSDKAA